jgi:hypothetical protein
MNLPGSSPTSTAAVPSSAEGAAVVEPSASYSILMRVRLPQRPGAFGQVATAIGPLGGSSARSTSCAWTRARSCAT